MAVTIAEPVAVEHAVQEQGRQLVARGEATPVALHRGGVQAPSCHAGGQLVPRAEADIGHEIELHPLRSVRGPRADLSGHVGRRKGRDMEMVGSPAPPRTPGETDPREAGLDVAEIGGGHQQVDLGHPPCAGFWRRGSQQAPPGVGDAEPGRSQHRRDRVRECGQATGRRRRKRADVHVGLRRHQSSLRAINPAHAAQTANRPTNRRPRGSAARVRTSTPRGGSRNGVTLRLARGWPRGRSAMASK